MAISMITSCVPQRKMLYLQNEITMNDSLFMSMEYPNEKHFDYKVQPGDNLQIRIASLDTKSASFFNNMSSIGAVGTSASQYSSGNPAIYISGYIVNENGFIDVPIVGELQVKDLTIEEIIIYEENVCRLQRGFKRCRIIGSTVTYNNDLSYCIGSFDGNC